MLAFVGIPVYLFVMCICTGEVFLKLFGKGEGKNAGKNIIAGYVICAGLFHIISTPFMYYELSFSPVSYTHLDVYKRQYEGISNKKY